MGISREVWERTGGFLLTRLGEDIEFSIRIHSMGFNIGLIPDAIVYHKRRTDLIQFYKQLHFFGRARINIYKHFASELKVVHFFPALFTLFLCLSLILNLFNHPLAEKTLMFQGKILNIREATADELAHGHVHGEGGVQH
jgi:GT2 family glycosyltransferase